MIRKDIFLDAEKLCLVLGHYVREHLDVQRTGTKTDEACSRRLRVGSGIAEEHFPKLCKDVAQKFRSRLVTQTDHRFE